MNPAKRKAADDREMDTDDVSSPLLFASQQQLILKPFSGFLAETLAGLLIPRSGRGRSHHFALVYCL